MKLERILIVDRLGQELASAIAERESGLEFRVRSMADVDVADLEWAHVYVGFHFPEGFDPSSLRWVHCTGAGVDGFLWQREWPEGLMLTRTTGAFGLRIGEFCLARALAFTQRLPESFDAHRERRWDALEAETLSGQSVCILGTGSVGAGIARAFRAANCRVFGASRRGFEREAFERVCKLSDLGPELLKDLGFLIVVLPLTRETENCVDRRLLAGLDGARVINVARGAILVDDDLLWALDAGHVSAAALDVFRDEPLPRDSAFFRHARVLVSAHVAARTLLSEARESFVESLAALRAGLEPRLAVPVSRGY